MTTFPVTLEENEIPPIHFIATYSSELAQYSAREQAGLTDETAARPLAHGTMPTFRVLI